MYPVLAATAAIGLVLYPLLVFMLLDRSPSGLLVVVLAVLGIARLATTRFVERRVRIGAIAALLAFCAAAWIGPHLGLVKLYPVLVSLVGMGYGLWTLANPPSAAERFARSFNPNEQFDDRKRAYTRRVTQVWVGFFLFNASMATYTTLGASIGVWTLYNGFISYMLIGLLFGGEYAIRRVVQRKYDASAAITS